VLKLQLLPILLLCAPAAAQHHFVLTDAATNLHMDTFQVSAADLGQPGDWSVQRLTLRGGKQEGVDSIVIRTDTLTAVILPTRGMSVHHIDVAGVRVGWDSPSADIVHPALINLDSRGGLGWLDGFNEALVRCGLEYAGHPGEDEIVDNVGNISKQQLTLHGRIGNLSASRVELVIDEEAPYRIRLRATIYERSFYGPRLQLDAEFSVVPGTRAWRIKDKVTNIGASEQEFQLIYHGNYGPPFLGEGARCILPGRTVAPMNAKAEEEIAYYGTYRAPTLGFVEEVYLFEPAGDEDGRTMAMLINPTGDLATSVSWNLSELPYFTLWKNTAALKDGYVTGLEPGTGFPFNRKFERKHGRVPKLAAGESRSFTLDYALHLGAEVKAAETRINKMRPDAFTIVKGVPK
jgi:hypothetical protein